MSIKSLINVLNGKAFVILMDIHNCISGCAIRFSEAHFNYSEEPFLIIENQNRDNVRLQLASISSIVHDNDEYVIKTDEASFTFILN